MLAEGWKSVFKGVGDETSFWLARNRLWFIYLFFFFFFATRVQKIDLNHYCCWSLFKGPCDWLRWCQEAYWVPEVYCVRFTQCFGSGGSDDTADKGGDSGGRHVWPEVKHCQAVGTIAGIIYLAMVTRLKMHQCCVKRSGGVWNHTVTDKLWLPLD